MIARLVQLASLKTRALTSKTQGNSQGPKFLEHPHSSSLIPGSKELVEFFFVGPEFSEQPKSSSLPGV
jgi:hypothetical protein